MSRPWVLSLLGGFALISLTSCAESRHQTERLDVLSRAQENDYADVYYDSGPFFYSPGFWWSPFAYYPGYYGSGYGPGYPGYPYPGYYPGMSSGGGGAAPRPTPPPNAPPQFFKRKD